MSPFGVKQTSQSGGSHALTRSICRIDRRLEIGLTKKHAEANLYAGFGTERFRLARWPLRMVFPTRFPTELLSTGWEIDGIRRFVIGEKCQNFRMKPNCTIQGKMDRNGLGNRCSILLSYGTIAVRSSIGATMTHGLRFNPLSRPKPRRHLSTSCAPSPRRREPPRACWRERARPPPESDPEPISRPRSAAEPQRACR